MTCAAQTIDSCLVCGGSNLEEVLDLGKQPLANNWLKTKETQPAYPLRLMVCGGCFHFQQAVAVDPNALYKNYLYVSGTSKTLDEYFVWFAQHAEAVHGGGRPLRVLDIAGNDGSLLSKFKARGHSVTCVDPARNLAPLAQKKGIVTHTAFWDSSFARALEETYDVVIAMNVLAHVANPLDFLQGCAHVLAKDGVVFVQTSQADMLTHGEFDTIYHEHHSFFHTRPLRLLAHKAGFRVRQARHVPVHGNSYLWTLSKDAEEEESVGRMIEEETVKGFYDFAKIRGFEKRARRCVAAVREHVEAARLEKFFVVGFGAAAKGVVFLNFAQCHLDVIVDDSPLKQGRFLPGANIPVVSSQKIYADPKNIFWFITAWNFREEIFWRIKEHRKNKNDRFLVAFPKVEVFAA